MLVGFAKTKLLAPGESETVTITVDPYTMASYDYNDANLNDFCGYELDPGTYTLYVGTNAHDAWTNGAAGTFTLDESILYETDPVTGNAVENRFDEVSEHFEDGNAVRLSRSDWEDSFPTYMDEDDLVIDEETFDKLEMTVVDAAFDEDQPWYTDVMPVQADPIELAEGETAPAAPIQFAELIGLDREDPKWTAFMDQFTIAELGAMMSGNYSIPGIERLGIPVTHAVDGPVGFVYQMGEKFGVTGVFYAAPVMGCCDVEHRSGGKGRRLSGGRRSVDALHRHLWPCHQHAPVHLSLVVTLSTILKMASWLARSALPW